MTTVPAKTKPKYLIFHEKLQTSKVQAFGCLSASLPTLVLFVQVYLRDASVVGAMPLCLFANTLKFLATERPKKRRATRGRQNKGHPSNEDDGDNDSESDDDEGAGDGKENIVTVDVDGWVKFKFPQSTAELLHRIRNALQRILAQKLATGAKGKGMHGKEGRRDARGAKGVIEVDEAGKQEKEQAEVEAEAKRDRITEAIIDAVATLMVEQ